MIFVTGNACDGCGECVDACPANAIMLQNGKATIDHERCEGCQACLAVCRRGALSDREAEPALERVALIPKMISSDLIPIHYQTGSESLGGLALPAIRSSQEVNPQIDSLEEAQNKRATVSLQLLRSILLWTGREIVPRLANLALNHLDQRIASTEPKTIRTSAQIRNQKNQGRGSGRKRRQRLHRMRKVS